jgi:hypothetical protein
VSSQDAEDTNDPNASDQNLELERLLKAWADQQGRDPRATTLGIRPDRIEEGTSAPDQATPEELRKALEEEMSRIIPPAERFPSLGMRPLMPDVREGNIEVIRGRDRRVEEVEPQDKP